MKLNQWTLALAAAGVVSLESMVQAEEKEQKMNPLLTAVSSTTLSGYVSTSAIWKPGTNLATTHNASALNTQFSRGLIGALRILFADYRLLDGRVQLSSRSAEKY